MNLQSIRKWKGLIAFIAAAAVVGCAPSAYLTVASVPNPVFLSGPSHIKTDRNDVEVEVECSRTETSDGYYSQTNTKAEGANKASVAVLKATQGSDSLDVHLSRMEVGAYFLGFFSQGIQKNWVGITGGIAGAGKGNK